MIVDILKDPTKLQAMSKNAYNSTDNISYATTWKQWQQLINA